MLDFGSLPLFARIMAQARDGDDEKEWMEGFGWLVRFSRLCQNHSSLSLSTLSIGNLLSAPDFLLLARVLHNNDDGPIVKQAAAAAAVSKL